MTTHEGIWPSSRPAKDNMDSPDEDSSKKKSYEAELEWSKRLHKNKTVTDTLFDIPEQKSPRLKWMQEKNISTHLNNDVQAGDEDEFSGEQIYPWTAFTGKPRFPRPDAGYGDSEHEAIVDLAIKKGWRLWNETAHEI